MHGREPRGGDELIEPADLETIGKLIGIEATLGGDVEAGREAVRGLVASAKAGGYRAPGAPMGREVEASLRSNLVELSQELEAALGDYGEAHQIVRSASMTP